MTECAAFRITPDLRFLYPQPAHEAAFAELNGAVRRGAGLALVDGGVGTGKTILLRRLEATLRSSGLRPRYIPYPELSLAALLDWVNDEPASTQTGRPIPSSILLLDDAENCSNELLSGVQELAAKRRERPHGPQIILVGGKSLWPRMLRELPNLAELIDTHVAMSPLSADEIGQYIRHRLQVAGRPADLFSPEATAAIAAYSRGVPRLVNQVCSRALILADLEQAASISQETIAEAIEDCPVALFEQNARLATIPAATGETPLPSAPIPAAVSDLEMATSTQKPENTRLIAVSEPVPPPTPEPMPQAQAVATTGVETQPPAVVAIGPEATQPAPPARVPLADQRRKERRLKFKAVDVENAAATAAETTEPPEYLPAFSGFVPRQKLHPVQPAPVNLRAPDGATAAFSGFVPRRKQPDKPTATPDSGPAATAGRGARRTRTAAAALATAVVAGAAFYVLRVSPNVAETAYHISNAAIVAVRDLYVELGERLRH